MSDVVREAKDASRVERLGEVYDLAIGVLKDHFSGKKIAASQDLKAAGSLVAQWRGIRQTDSARAALNFAIGREIFSDPADLRRFVEVTQPTIAYALDRAKALPAAVDGEVKAA